MFEVTEYTARPRDYITFFMLNSAEHEILNAYKYKNIEKFGFFLDSDRPRMLFFRSQMLKCQQKQEKFHAQLS